MMNFGALNWFNSFIKKLKKPLHCINYMIYTCYKGGRKSEQNNMRPLLVLFTNGKGNVRTTMAITYFQQLRLVNSFSLPFLVSLGIHFRFWDYLRLVAWWLHAILLTTAWVSTSPHCPLWPLGACMSDSGTTFSWLHDILFTHVHSLVILLPLIQYIPNMIQPK